MTKNGSRNTSIYWSSEETGRRARWMAEAKDLSMSRFLSALVDERYEELYPKPPIRALCAICDRETDFVFLAYWADASDLYQCADCGKVRQEDDLASASDGQKRPMEKTIQEKMEAVS